MTEHRAYVALQLVIAATGGWMIGSQLGWRVGVGAILLAWYLRTD